jgi:DNA (cytosine-5)-methyltransferase 1
VEALRSSFLGFDELSRNDLALITHGVQFKRLFPSRRNPFRHEMNVKFGEKASQNFLGQEAVGLTPKFAPPKRVKFRFIDLFAGIGGMRLAFEDRQVGGACVFSSEWDKYAQQTYFANFNEIPFGDITKIDKDLIPDHEILLAGFPCQTFSIAGRRAGFEDTRGTLFFEVAETLRAKQPSAFLLENVKGLKGHNKGQTLERILEVLRELGYFVVEPKILNARDFGVAQNRERIFIVGFKSKTHAESFSYPKPLGIGHSKTIADIRENGPVSVKYYLSDQYLQTLRKHRSRHERAGNGFGFQILDDSQVANAVVVGGMGRERNLLFDHHEIDLRPVTKIQGPVNSEGVRRMTPHEWRRVQGFPEGFLIPISDAQAYKQFGNSVAVPAVRATAIRISKALDL